MSNTEQELATQPSGLVTIERVVAFVVGPAVVAGSAWLSAFLASKLGVEVASGEITAVAATGGIGAAGIIYKWLDGRSKSTLQKTQLLAENAQKFVAKEGVPIATQDGIIHIAEKDFIAFAHSVAQSTADVIQKATVPTTKPASEQSEPEVPPVEDEPIIPPLHDPAPATPLDAEPPIPVAQQPPAPPAQ